MNFIMDTMIYKRFINSKKMTPTVAATIIQRYWRKYKNNKRTLLEQVLSWYTSNNNKNNLIEKVFSWYQF
jgi:hypothetical protein